MNWAQLWVKKPLSDEGDSGLKRCLSTFDLTMLGVGAIIGTGIFVLTGHVAAVQAGPSVIISFVIAGLACAFAALSYAELAASVGGTGSAYGYSYAAFGELLAWIIGWDLLLEYAVSVSAVAVGWSGYFVSALNAVGIHIPEALTKAPASGGIVDLPAAGIILILMAMLIVGVKQSARLNAAMVFLKLLVIVVFITLAFGNIDASNWDVFAPFGWFTKTNDGHTIGILAGASMVFFAYIGFDAVSTASAEAKNPQHGLSRGILYSLAICTVLYILVAGLLTAVVHYSKLNVTSPVALALESMGYTWATAAVATAVIMGLTTVMLVTFYALTRILLGIANDGLLPPYFKSVNAKTKTPVHNTVICGVVTAATAGFMPFGVLAELVNIGTLAAFVMVCVGVIVLRKTQPDLPRPFKVPGGMITPVLGILSCGALTVFLPAVTQLRFLGWLAIGLLIYFAYSWRHSKMRATTNP